MKISQPIALLALLLAACAGDGPSTATIVATAGGTVSTGTADITIPPSSLAADTNVSLGRAEAGEYPAVPGDRSVIIELEPAGTVLELAATVTIHGEEVDASATDSVSVFQLIDAVWSPREYSRDSETGDIRTSITVFAPLGVGISAAGVGGSIQGTITWGDGSPIDMAPVELYQGDTLVESTRSAANGQYGFEGLEAGSYNLRVNYECMVDQSVSVAAGMSVTQDLVVCGS